PFAAPSLLLSEQHIERLVRLSVRLSGLPPVRPARLPHVRLVAQQPVWPQRRLPQLAGPVHAPVSVAHLRVAPRARRVPLQWLDAVAASQSPLDSRDPRLVGTSPTWRSLLRRP